MNRFYHIIFLLFFALVADSQNSASSVSADLSTQEMSKLVGVYQITTDFIIKNTSDKKLYILRADVSKELKVRVHKRTLLPNDTTHLFILFSPVKTGKFKEKISVVISSDVLPLELSISGEITSLKPDDKQACYAFSKSQKIAIPTNNYLTLLPEKEAAIIESKPIYKDSIPDDHVMEEIPEPTKMLDPIQYKPNNIVFLVDVSGSMRDADKLPLMKEVLIELIEVLRPTDKISFVTYADSAKLLLNGVGAERKGELKNIINSLSTKGYTKGAKAILYSEGVAIDNYINEGVNQVYLISDGKFPFYAGHYKQWEEKQTNKNILLSTIGLGNDKEALKSLSGIAQMGKGSFVRVKSKASVVDLVEDLKLRSKR